MEIKIKDYSHDDLKACLHSLIAKTYLNCGQILDKEFVKSTINEFCSDLLEYNSSISFQQIEIAFKNGYKGEYGEWFGLCNKTYFHWINTFIFSEKRKNAINAIKNAEKKDSKEIEQEEADKIIVNGIIEQWEVFKRGDRYFGSCTVTYKKLDSMGLIKFTPERKKEFMKQAEDEILKEEKDVEGRSKTELKNIIKGILQNGHLITVRAIKIAVNTYFKELQDMGMELTEIINEKLKDATL